MNRQIHKTDCARFLQSRCFLTGVALLIINDFLLKQAFANTLTGKLSDFAGLFVFPFFFAAFIPKWRTWVYGATGILFCLWKSPVSQFVINTVNSFDIVHIGRVVDYTDLVALLVLPVSHYVFDTIAECPGRSAPSLSRPATTFVAIASLFAFTATQSVDDRSVRIEKKYVITMDRQEFESKLRDLGNIRELEIINMTEVWPPDQYPDVHADPKEYWVSFRLSERYCGSNELQVYATYRDEENSVRLDYAAFSYSCPTKPTASDYSQLTAIFERALVARIRGPNQDDKTPRP